MAQTYNITCEMCGDVTQNSPVPGAKCGVTLTDQNGNMVLNGSFTVGPECSGLAVGSENISVAETKLLATFPYSAAALAAKAASGSGTGH